MLHHQPRGTPSATALFALATVLGLTSPAQGHSVFVAPASRSALGSADSSQCGTFNGQRLYVGYFSYTSRKSGIAVFDALANGSVSPICDITYPFQAISGLAIDHNNHLWAVDGALFPSQTVSLLVFDHAANGNANPAQTITGSKTLLSHYNWIFQGIAVGAADNVWVPNFYYTQKPLVVGGYLSAFANGANGNVAPAATIGYAERGIDQSLTYPTAVALDREGDIFYTRSTSPGFVGAFKPPFSQNEKPVATWWLPGRQTTSRYLTIDSNDNFIVAGTSLICVFDGGLQAKKQPTSQLATPSGVSGIATDAQNHVYVAYVDHIDILPANPTKYSPLRTIRWNGGTHIALTTIAVGN